MTEGDVVLASLLQADGSVKVRPAIYLRELPPFRDLLLCGVSSQLHQEVTGFDDRIGPNDSDFAATGLKSESLIRLGFLAVVPRGAVVGSIGSISSERRGRLLSRLSAYLMAG